MDYEKLKAHRAWIVKTVAEAKALNGFPGTGAVIHMGDIAIELMDELVTYQRDVQAEAEVTWECRTCGTERTDTIVGADFIKRLESQMDLADEWLYEQAMPCESCRVELKRSVCITYQKCVKIVRGGK